MALSFIIFCVLIVIVLLFYYVQRKYKYWADRGAPFVKPKFPLGSMQGVGTKITVAEMMQNCYNDLKGQGGPLGGVYFFTEPVALVVDMDLLRSVFVKDFQYFHDRGMYVNERDDPLSAHLFSLAGEQWKRLRAQLSPTFTSGKMKMMHPTILQVADQFKEHLVDLTKSGETELELKDLLSRFTTDVIGNVAFGIECNCMKDPQSEFRRIGKKIFEYSQMAMFRDIFVSSFPNLAKRLHMTTNKPEVTSFFLKLLGDTVKYREENNVQRNDFMSLLLQIKNTGKLEGEKEVLGKMTFNELAAQVFLFFIAGFETSSSTMTFAFYELALHQEIQEEARNEIREVMKRHDGQLNYDAAMELHYVDRIIQGEIRLQIFINSSITVFDPFQRHYESIQSRTPC